MQVKLRRFWIQLTSDRKRFGLLCTMLALGMLLWARIIIVRNVPRTVVAADDAPAEQAAAAQRSRGGTPPTSESITGNAAPIEVVLDLMPQRDPFVISPVYFPKPTDRPDLTQDQGKSAAQFVEDAESTRNRWRALINERLSRLRLEAVMSSPPMASINGRTYRQGDVIATDHQDTIRFTLTDVRERSVIVEFDGRSFELRLPSYGEPRDR